MVTKNQIDRLSVRISELAERLGQTKRPTYVVWLSFSGETDKSFTLGILTRAVAVTRRSASRLVTMRVPHACRVTDERV